MIFDVDDHYYDNDDDHDDEDDEKNHLLDEGPELLAGDDAIAVGVKELESLGTKKGYDQAPHQEQLLSCGNVNM